MSLYLKNGRPKVCYNWFGTVYTVEAPEKLPAGKHAVRFHFDYDGGGLGKGGKMTISIDGKKVAQGRIENTVPFAFSIETVDVGADHGQPVADDYSSNVFTGGSLNSVLRSSCMTIAECGLSEPAQSKWFHNPHSAIRIPQFLEETHQSPDH
jgi:hypothetical protein